MFTKPTDSDNRQRVWKYVLVGVIALMGVVVLVHATLSSNANGNNRLVRRSALEGMIGDSESSAAADEITRIYYLTFLTRPFGEVKRRCELGGGKLAMIRSSKENGKVESECGQRKCWIGLKGGNKLFAWLDSSIPPPSRHTYQKWKPGEPNDKHGEENCVEMYGDRHGQWNDQSCSDLNRGVCQRDGFQRYFVTKTKGTFDEVKQTCEVNNGVLTSLTEGDVAEAASVCRRHGHSDCYIGLTSRGSGNGWHWVGSQNHHFRNWKDNKVPNNKDKHCAKMSTSSGKWTNVKCSTKLFGICRHIGGAHDRT